MATTAGEALPAYLGQQLTEFSSHATRTWCTINPEADDGGAAKTQACTKSGRQRSGCATQRRSSPRCHGIPGAANAERSFLKHWHKEHPAR